MLVIIITSHLESFLLFIAERKHPDIVSAKH